MKRLRALALASILVITFAACDRRPSAADVEADRRRDEERQADDRRIAELRDLEQKAAQRETAAAAAQNDAERQKIEAERAALERDRANLTEAQRAAEEQRIALQQAKQDRAEAAQRAAAQHRAEEIANAAQPARGEQKLDFFYNALDPYGDWIELDNYGYVWQPNEARDAGWRPYTDGRWAWTDYGWTWASNERFGWAVYHYGRWVRVQRVGWVWVPGSEWAPAWVSWRHSPDYVGWAPLPPEAHSHAGFTAAVDSYYDIGPSSYSFIPVEHFAERTYVGRVVPPEQSISIVSQTTNITNVTYRNVQNTSVVYNAGPDVAVVEAQTHAPVQRLTVERIADPSAAGSAVQSGNVLRLLAPAVASATRAATTPAKVKTHITSAEVNHGWTGVDPQAAQAMRAKLTQDAKAVEQKQRSASPASTVSPVVASPAIAPPPRPVEPKAVPVNAAEDERKAELLRRQTEQQREAAMQKQTQEAAAQAAAKRAADERKRAESEAHAEKPARPSPPIAVTPPANPAPVIPLKDKPATPHPAPVVNKPHTPMPAPVEPKSPPREPAAVPKPAEAAPIHPPAPAKPVPPPTPHPVSGKPPSPSKGPAATPPGEPKP